MCPAVDYEHSYHVIQPSCVWHIEERAQIFNIRFGVRSYLNSSSIIRTHVPRLGFLSVVVLTLVVNSWITQCLFVNIITSVLKTRQTDEMFQNKSLIKHSLKKDGIQNTFLQRSQCAVCTYLQLHICK